MIIACIGDSLTEGDYGVFGKRGIADIRQENYPYFLSRITGAEVRNFGRCGHTASRYLQYYKEGNVNLAGADAVIIMLGTNGGFDKDADTQDNRDFALLVDLCKKDAPGAKIVLCTPPHVTENPEFSNCGYAPKVKKAVEFVRDYAQRNEMYLIDTANCPDFTAENEHIMQSNDGLHFVEAGYRTLAQFIAENLNHIL